MKTLINYITRRRWTNWEVIDVYYFNGQVYLLEVKNHLKTNKCKTKVHNIGYRYSCDTESLLNKLK